MVSQKLFETVESICRVVRKIELFFGGIQVILSGDFYQLPPVPDELYGETGKHCFECSYFFSAIPHHIQLETIFRHTNCELIECVNNLEKGLLNQNNVDFLRTLTEKFLKMKTQFTFFPKILKPIYSIMIDLKSFQDF